MSAAAKKASTKPALSMGTKKAVGTRMECPTCGYKWSRPPGEDNKPCPKCFKPLPKNAGAAPAARSPVAAAKPKAVVPPKAAAAAPKPAAPAAAAEATDAPAAAPAAASPTAAAPRPKAVSTSSPAKKPVGAGGARMECPTCGFKWTRPPGEDNKPCPKCFKPLPKGYTGTAIVSKSPANKSPSGAGKASIFDKLTDPKQYTGAHKQRFDSDGKGRGIAGRY